MSWLVGLGIVVVLVAFLVVSQWYARKRKEAAKTVRLLSGGSLLFLTLFCIYGFLASGELQGAAQIGWKVGYGALGILSMVGAIYLAIKKR